MGRQWHGAILVSGASPGPEPWHAVGPCTASAPYQQLACTIVQTQEGSDSRVSRAGRNQRRRHLLVSDNEADGGSERRAGEDRPSSPQESSRKGRAKPHSTRRLHFLELFALKGGSSALYALFSPALPAPSWAPALQPPSTPGLGMGCLHPELTRSKVQVWVMDESWSVVPLLGQGGQSLGQTKHRAWWCCGSS